MVPSYATCVALFLLLVAPVMAADGSKGGNLRLIEDFSGYKTGPLQGQTVPHSAAHGDLQGVSTNRIADGNIEGSEAWRPLVHPQDSKGAKHLNRQPTQRRRTAADPQTDSRGVDVCWIEGHAVTAFRFVRRALHVTEVDGPRHRLYQVEPGICSSVLAFVRNGDQASQMYTGFAAGTTVKFQPGIAAPADLFDSTSRQRANQRRSMCGLIQPTPPP